MGARKDKKVHDLESLKPPCWTLIERESYMNVSKLNSRWNSPTSSRSQHKLIYQNYASSTQATLVKMMSAYT